LLMVSKENCIQLRQVLYKQHSRSSQVRLENQDLAQMLNQLPLQSPTQDQNAMVTQLLQYCQMATPHWLG
jgi:hypothetical protein